MTEQEIREYFDREDKVRGLGIYAKEKREMDMFVEKLQMISPSERRSLRAQALMIASQKWNVGTDLDTVTGTAEHIYQWIIKE